jgi:hypothetical protein
MTKSKTAMYGNHLAASTFFRLKSYKWIYWRENNNLRRKTDKVIRFYNIIEREENKKW